MKCASELFFSKGKEMLTLAWDDRKLRQESTLLRKSKAQMTRPCVRTQSWGRQYTLDFVRLAWLFNIASMTLNMSHLTKQSQRELKSSA